MAIHMDHDNRLPRLLFAALAALLALAAPARAGQVLSLNMAGSGTGMTPAMVAGVPGTLAQVNNWNNLIVPSNGVADYVGSFAGTLTLSDGSPAAGSSASWAWHGHNGSGVNDDLFQSNWDPFDWTPDLTLNVTGVPFARYDVIAYVPASGYSAGERGGEIAANGQTRLVRMFKDFTGFPKYVESTAAGPYSGNPLDVPEGTYVRFTGLSGNLTLTTDSKFGARLRLAGVQIIDPAVHVGGQGTLGTLELDAMLIGGTPETPLTGARVVKIIQNKSGSEAHLHFREIEALEGATNWSLAGATASQSTTYAGLAASRAIDGDLGTWNHTETGLGQWVAIDLGAQRTLDTLRIYNRIDCCQGRASDIQVQIYGDPAQTQLLFDQRVLGLDVSPYVKDVTLGVLVGAVSVAEMDPFADYHLELGDNETSDRIVVPLLPLAGSTELHVAGDLVVSAIGSSLRVGDTFQLLVADRIVGSFASIALPEVSGIGGWDLSNLYVNGTITAVPEPCTLALLGLGACALALVGRGRKRVGPGA